MESEEKNARELGRETGIFFPATAPFSRSCTCYFRLVCYIFAISLLSKSLAQHTFAKPTFVISYIGWEILLFFARGSILVWLWFNLYHVSYFQNYSLLAYKRKCSDTHNVINVRPCSNVAFHIMSNSMHMGQKHRLSLLAI